MYLEKVNKLAVNAFNDESKHLNNIASDMGFWKNPRYVIQLLRYLI